MISRLLSNFKNSVSHMVCVEYTNLIGHIQTDPKCFYEYCLIVTTTL